MIEKKVLYDWYQKRRKTMTGTNGKQLPEFLFTTW
jgi:hypothetical protein